MFLAVMRLGVEIQGQCKYDSSCSGQETGLSIQITTRGLRVGVSGVFCPLCLCNFQFPSCWLGLALCAEQCLRRRGSFNFNDTVFGGVKTTGNVLGYVGGQRRAIV